MKASPRDLLNILAGILTIPASRNVYIGEGIDLHPMDPTPPNPETLFLDLLTTSVAEARETGQIISSPHEAYAMLLEKLEAYWREVRNRRDPEVLLDHLVALATQCVTAADDLFVKQVIDENNSEEVK